mmetsp:Transcript_35358/g.110525  ORF Transcript_35358/g.110525 Transcript_35358/m.110525 type:complete len:119 (-) Transcript_35358:289-645(-)
MGTQSMVKLCLTVAKEPPAEPKMSKKKPAVVEEPVEEEAPAKKKGKYSSKPKLLHQLHRQQMQRAIVPVQAPRTVKPPRYPGYELHAAHLHTWKKGSPLPKPIIKNGIKYMPVFVTHQ